MMKGDATVISDKMCEARAHFLSGLRDLAESTRQLSSEASSETDHELVQQLAHFGAELVAATRGLDALIAARVADEHLVVSR